MKLQIGIDGKTYEVEVEVVEDDALAQRPHYGPLPAVLATLQSASVPASQPAPKENVEEGKVCRSPVSGVVIRVNVQPGQEIQADDLMLVLEAMKMEANVTAPRAGKIKTVRVAQGDPVKGNQVVVEFE